MCMVCVEGVAAGAAAAWYTFPYLRARFNAWRGRRPRFADPARLRVESMRVR